MMSPTMSPPPMLMPTPILGGSNPQSMTSPLLMPVPGASGSGQPQADSSGAAMAFTYVPVPVYNMAGMAIPGMGNPGMQGQMQGQPSAFPNMSGLGVMSPGSMAPQGIKQNKQIKNKTKMKQIIIIFERNLFIEHSHH